MSATETDGLFSYTDDADFKKKFAIACVCTFGTLVVVPGLLLLGYSAQTMKRATLGRRGLPEWSNFGEMFTLGGATLLSLVYLLPSALLTALSVLPLLSGQASFMSVSSLISRFIQFGALMAFVVGLALSVTALHTYLSSGKLADLFNFSVLYAKIRAKKADLGFLIGLAAVGILAVSFVNWLLGWLGFLVGIAGTTFISLMVSYGSGYILGKTTPQLPEESAAAATKLTPGKDSSVTEPVEEPAAEDSEDRWVPS